MSSFNINNYVGMQMQQDLEEYANLSYYEYKFKNKKDLKFVKDNFIFVYENKNIIYFSINKKIIRKIKLYVLSNEQLGDRLLKILSKSKVSNGEDLIMTQLSDELCRSID